MKIKVKKLDVVVALMSGSAVFVLLLGIPLWALFFGWGWYFALGSTPAVFKRALPPMLLGYTVGGIAIFIDNIVGNIFVLAAVGACTVFVIMLSSHTKLFSHTIVSFNAYSILFAGYYFGAFPGVEPRLWDANNLLICIGWLGMTNLIGLLFGYVSIRLGVGIVKEKEAE